MKRSFIVLIFVSLVIIAGFLLVDAGNEATDESEYTLISVRKMNLDQSVIATGIIKPKVGAEVKVGAQVSGIVKELFVDVGSKVEKGEVLAIIDADVYTTKAEQAHAIKEIAETENKYALIEFNRSKALRDKNVITDQELEVVSQRFEISSAKLKQIEAEYNYACLQLSYTRITSPISGVVASISTQKGETVAASFSAPTFVTIIDLNNLELWAYVDETDIGRISKGQKVSFTIDTYSNNVFEGTVETVYPKAEIQNNVVNYITVIKFIQPHKSIPESSNGRNDEANSNPAILRPEMTATVRVFTETKEDVLVLLKQSVQSENGKKFVNIFYNGKIEKRYITTGISDKKYYEILTGLSGKEKVILGKADFTSH